MDFPGVARCQLAAIGARLGGCAARRQCFCRGRDARWRHRHHSHDWRQWAHHRRHCQSGWWCFGVSTNTYREFNVPRAGVDLDNSAASARTILNQVTSTNPSVLEGPLAVLGPRANVVIANPNGVSVNGMTVQGVGNLALTTGQVTFNDFKTANGQLQRNLILNTGQGAIDIGADGLSGTLLNLELVAKQIRIGGKVENLYGDPHARVRAVAGTSRAEIDTSVSPTDNLTPWITYAAPAVSAGQGVALDITAAGSLVAGRIELMVTDQGAGVRHAGAALATAGDFVVSGTGDLQLVSGKIGAKQDVLIGSGGLTGTGDLSAGRYLQVSADRVDLTGSTLAAGTATAGDLVIGAQGQAHAQPVRLADTTLAASRGIGLLDAGAGIALTGVRANAGGNLLIETPTLTTAAGASRTSLTAAGTVTVVAGETTLAGTDVDGVSGTTTRATNLSMQDTRLQSSGGSVAMVATGRHAQSAGNTTITATGGNANIQGALTSDGDTTITAGQDATVAGALASGGNTAMRATSGSATVSGALFGIGDVSVTAGQNATLGGSVTTGGNLGATAGQTLSVGGLDWVGGNATLRGHDIAMGSAPGASNIVNGTLDASAARNLTLTGDTQAGNATLHGAAVGNQGATVALRQMTVNGGTVTNTGMLVGDQVNVTATDLVNRGILGGQSATLNVANSLDNAQGLLVGAQRLDVTTAALASNPGGTIFAGDLSGRNPYTGDLSMTVTGVDGSFNNAGGQLLASNNLTLNTPNQTFDPSGAATGTLNANGTLTLAAQAIRNTGTWDVPGANVVLQASNGITNTGTIQKAGDLTLATGGALENSGQIVGGSNLSLSAGTLTNTGTIHANGDLSMAGNVVNPGSAEALGNVAITGGDYDNRGGTTQAGGDLKFDLAGTLNNTGSTIGALGNLRIAAGTVINDRTAPVDAGSTTGKVINNDLLNSLVIGSHATADQTCPGDAGCSGNMKGPPANLTIGELVRNADGTIPLIPGPVQVSSGDLNGSMQWVPMWHIGLDPANNPLPPGEVDMRVALPTVDRTVVKQADGVAGQIVSGGNLDITAASLSNQGGVISATRDVTLSVNSLNNGRSASLLDGVTDAVNEADMNAFLTQLQTIGSADWRNAPPGSRSLMVGALTKEICQGVDNCYIPVATDVPLLVGMTASGAAVTAPVQNSTTERLGKSGQITAGGNLALNGTGDLTNAGDLTALGNIKITTPGTFTNQGAYTSQITTTPGCVAGAPDCPDDSNARVQTLAWHQAPSTVAAGGTLTVQAANIENLNATLAAQGDVSLAATSSVTNRAGAIQSLTGDVSITAPTLVNQTLDPVTLYKSYGGQNPSYAGGCNPGGTNGNSQCAAREDTAAGPAAVISGARDVRLSGTTLTNKGSLITGGRDVTVEMTGAIDNRSISLNADWFGRWQEERGGGDRWHDTGGRTTLGSLESGIQAGNTLSVKAGGQILNTGM